MIGVDIDPAKVGEVNSGIPPISEPGLDQLLSAQVQAGRFHATTSVAEAVEQTDLALIAVGTPSSDDGSVSAHAVERVVHAIGEAVRNAAKPYRIVIRSTLLPGILEDRLLPALENAAGRPVGTDLGLCNNPEFLAKAQRSRTITTRRTFWSGPRAKWTHQLFSICMAKFKLRNTLPILGQLLW